MQKKAPLKRLIIIDLSRILSGPYATMVLADQGARVIKIEMPITGDDARQFGPFKKGKSIYFASLNRGKESIALNLKNAKDREVFESLIEMADVLVENFRPGTMEKLGYGWDSLHKMNSRLIYAAVSGFGQTGPYRKHPAYDLIVQGMGGLMSLTGHPDDEKPTRVGSSIGDIVAGMFCAIGILAALNGRRETGEGTLVDVSMLDSQVSILENAISRYLTDGVIPGPLGARHPSITPFAAYRAKNSYLTIAIGNNDLFNKLCEVIGRTDLSNSDEFHNNDLRTRQVDKLTSELERTLRERNANEWIDLLSSAGIPCGPINNIEQVVNDKQIEARNMIIRSDDPHDDNIRMIGNPIKYSAYADPAVRRAAPNLDADRDNILELLNLKNR